MKVLLSLIVLITSAQIFANSNQRDCKFIYKSYDRGFYYFNGSAEAKLLQKGKQVTREESDADLFAITDTVSMYNNHLRLTVQRRDGVVVYDDLAKGRNDAKNEQQLINKLSKAKFSCSK